MHNNETVNLSCFLLLIAYFYLKLPEEEQKSVN